ncbi:MAG: lon-related putative ATP-dependent protease [Gammaproteobacteria bacterium]|jgi:lon-related putative ATP-dependent protease
MNKVEPLALHDLYNRCDTSELQFTTTAELEGIDVGVGQDRALEAIRFGVRIDGDGYNIFALGPAGVGKLTVVKDCIAEQARSGPVPYDWCYVNNFQQQHRPAALRLPAGVGRRLQHDMAQLIEDLRSAIVAAFEGEEYQGRVAEIEEEFKEHQVTAMNELGEAAAADNVNLIQTPSGFAFAPLGENKEVIEHDEFIKLPKDEQKRIQSTVEELQGRLQKTLRQFSVWHKELWQRLKALNRELAEFEVAHLITDLRANYPELQQVLDYLDEIQRDVIDNVDAFRAEVASTTPPGAPQGKPSFARYAVNLLVDNSDQHAPPVIYEDLPNHANLIGRTEHKSEMGTLVTDFTLIKAGALHRANGGYLILDARQVLLQPFAWDTLKRALRAGEIRIDSLERMLSVISTTSLEPEPIPINVKVILLGERQLYYMLSAHDPDFIELFKVAADFDESMDRDSASCVQFARLLGGFAKHEGLLALDRDAVARMIEHSARVAGDSQKLSTHLRSSGNVVREADYWARLENRDVITRDDVQHAIDQQIYRSDRIRERIYEAIHRGTILIDTDGEVVGQMNALSVLRLDDFTFGQPSRITASVRLGAGKVIDIERETELGGPTHTKGVLILSSFLSARFAKDRPFSLSASLVFEQSYGGVDGDSASLAELCTLLSAIAELPIRQCFAMTGSVNQHGQVQAIGGVNEKIEGFFDVCAARGLTGKQGVIIPFSNVVHLMLRPDVLRAASEGRFQVYAVRTVDQAIELLTGITAGERDAKGSFPPSSVNAIVEQRLAEFSERRRQFTHEDAANNKGERDG